MSEKSKGLWEWTEVNTLKISRKYLLKWELLGIRKTSWVVNNHSGGLGVNDQEVLFYMVKHSNGNVFLVWVLRALGL